MLWFGHFFETANIYNRQYHSFLVYKERFRFMLSFFAPKQHFFFGNIPNTFKHNLMKDFECSQSILAKNLSAEFFRRICPISDQMIF